MASVFVKYRMRILIILMSIHLHRIRYLTLSYNTIRLIIEECIGDTNFNIIAIRQLVIVN